MSVEIAGKMVTAVGGGTGLSGVLRGLKELTGSGGLDQLVGVVTVTDDGGSSGRLRRELGMLPPGDIRNCLAALADDEDLLTRLFQYRFDNGHGLSGHSFGNLFLAALTGVTGSFYQAVLTAEQVLSVRGKILPATLQHVHLRGRGRSGRTYEGELEVGRAGEALDRLELVPAAPEAFPAAVEALQGADLILLGPGSLYTSILPNLLIPGIREAIGRSAAPVVLFMNLMTEPGETDAMGGAEHLEAIERQAGPGLVDLVVTNVANPSAERLSVYAEQGARPVMLDRACLEPRSVRLLERDLLAEGDLIRHDPAAIRAVVQELLADPAIAA
ncbi:MAG: uridine diphosphate-N-acetylglucosamine-binding protein YvcK [Acidobacteriota bacterium]|jgi:uncharacterized cofD-like protein